MPMLGCAVAGTAPHDALRIPCSQPLQHMQMPASGSIEADIIHPRALRTLGVHPLQRPQVPALGRAARTVRSPVNRRGAGSQPLQHVQMTPSRRTLTQHSTPGVIFVPAQPLQHPQMAAACPLDRYPLPTRHTKLSPRPDVQLNRGQKVVNPEQCTRHRRKHIPAPPRHESELGVARGA